MKISATVHTALGAERITLDEALAMMTPIWESIEKSILEQAAADAIAQGFNETDVRRVIETHETMLREGRPARLETAKQMLLAGATSVQ
jgi:hypothetical protein